MHDQNQMSPQSTTCHRPSFSSIDAPSIVPPWLQQQQSSNNLTPDFNAVHTPPESTPPSLPDFVKPFPERIGPDEVQYLHAKSALSIPDRELRTALLQGYVDFVYPFMPTIDLNDFLGIVEYEDGAFGKVSLLVFQAIMFAGSAFVDMSYLKRAGFQRRQDARKAFYTKARLLYDFDYEDDRIYLLQALLLMTYWYESPNDQKDTWHWMGIAISVATSIGLNKDPSRGTLDKSRRHLWKRLWWSCVIRDRLIAIGMRRPLRIKSSEHNVPMLTVEDFPLKPIPQDITCVSEDCVVARDESMRRKLALLCVAKAQFGDCISHVLSTQYSQATSSRSSAGIQTEYLLPKHKDQEGTEITTCDTELTSWLSNLPPNAQLPADDEDLSECTPASRCEAPLILNRALLHMVYYMTLSALYRPQASPTDVSLTPWEDLARNGPTTPRDTVRYAAFRITHIAQSLLKHGLGRYLPTTGVTVLQPAIISHMMDIKSPHPDVRTQGLRGFCQSIEVLNRLRDIYAGAEYSMLIIDAAVRRANIDATAWPMFKTPASRADTPDPEAPSPSANPRILQVPAGEPPTELAQMTPPSANRQLMSIEDLVDAGLRQKLVAPSARQVPLTPPPETNADEGVAGTYGDEQVAGGRSAANHILNDEAVARRLAMYFATTTPPSSSEGESQAPQDTAVSRMKTASDPLIGPNRLGATTPPPPLDLEKEFENLINTDDLADAFTSGDGGLATMQGESSGFFLDMDFLAGGAGDGGWR